MVMGPGGVLENVIALVGYEQFCYMIIDDPGLAAVVFEEVGHVLLGIMRFVLHMMGRMLMSNDDWGFKGQPCYLLRICAICIPLA